jgi:hypothetical protein
VSKTSSVFVALTLALAASAASAQPVSGTEQLHYKWSLRGGLSWIARIAFPSSGTGTLETKTAGNVSSRLTIGAKDGSAYYASTMTPDGLKTFLSEDGYSFNNRFENHKVTFDYNGGVAHVEKRSDEGVEQKVKTLQSAAAQDVLTAIYYLRQNADTITMRRQATVYSGGKGYQFIFTPEGKDQLRVGGTTYDTRSFSIAPADGKKKGAVRVWLTNDDDAKPVRMEIEQGYATMRLDMAN